MNHNCHITPENSNIIVKYTNERIIPSSSLAVAGGALLGRSNFIKKLNHMDMTKIVPSTRLRMEILSLHTSAAHYGFRKKQCMVAYFTDFKQKLTLRVQIFRMRLGGHSTWQRAKILNIKNHGVTNI